jgi:hypothetical protein
MLDWQGNGNWKKLTIGESHIFANSLVVGRAHETIQRTEAATGQQLQIAKRSLGQLDPWESFSVSERFLEMFNCKFDEFAAVRSY